MQKSFLIVIEKGNATYAAYAPDLPECVAVGQTLEEVEGKMQEVIALHLQELMQNQEPIPVPQTCARFVEVVIADPAAEV